MTEYTSEDFSATHDDFYGDHSPFGDEPTREDSEYCPHGSWLGSSRPCSRCYPS